MKDKYLPIGTVVILKEGKKELMITGIAIISGGKVIGKDENGNDKKEIRMHDYSGCLYPEGLITTGQTYAFDHKNIERIVFMGYETQAQKDLSDKIKVEVEKFKKKIGYKKEGE